MSSKLTERLTVIPGVQLVGRELRLTAEGTDLIGLRYTAIEQFAYGGRNVAAEMADVAEKQNAMFAQLQSQMGEILANPNDPRTKALNSVMKTFGGLPKPHDVQAMKADLAAVPPPTSADVSRPAGVPIEVVGTGEDSVASVEWLAKNFSQLMPGIVEAARYAYSRLEEEMMDEKERVAYIVSNPSDQDLLDRVRVESIRVEPAQRYTVSFETPSMHLEEHGMLAVFDGAQLLACGEYDEIAEFEYPAAEEG